MTPDDIQRVIDSKRTIHPELRAPLGWEELKRILAREGVIFAAVPLCRPAKLINYEGVWIVLVNSDSPARRHGYYVAHELGHLWLHTDPGEGRWTHCYHMEAEWPDDPREDDAELFVQMVYR